MFRFIDPRFSSSADVVNGEGALHAAGRWHPPGGTFRLSYTAAEPETALAETLTHARYFRLPLPTALPRVLVDVRLQVTRVLDLHQGARRPPAPALPGDDRHHGLAAGEPAGPRGSYTGPWRGPGRGWP